MFEEEELERFRSQRSYVYRHGAGVSMSCLAVFVVGLFITVIDTGYDVIIRTLADLA